MKLDCMACNGVGTIGGGWGGTWQCRVCHGLGFRAVRVISKDEYERHRAAMEAREEAGK